MSLTERIYGKQGATGNTAASSGEPSLAKHIYGKTGMTENAVASSDEPSLAKRIQQSRTPPSLYADAAAQLRQQSGNAARGSTSVLKTIFNKADDRTPTLYSGKYADYMKAGDYSELSKSAGSKRQFFGDEKYDYINNIANFRSQADLAQAQGRGGDYGKYAFMTSDEVGVYNYLYATQGRRAANRFLSDIEPELDKQWFSGANRGTVEALGKNAGTRALASAMTVAAQPVRNLTSVIAMGEDAVRSLRGQEINPYSKWRQPSNITQELRGDTASHIEETNPGLGGKVGSFVYNTAMSAADSAVNMLVAKGFGEAAGFSGPALMSATNVIGSLAMSSEVASLSIAESKEKGYSNEGALALGLTRGAIEFASEAVGGEWAIKIFKQNPTNLIKSVLLAMAPEGVEEVMSDAANGAVNLVVDALFGTQESGIPKMLEYYKQNGTPFQKEHPELATFAAVLGQEGLSFLGGALASVGSSTVQSYSNKQYVNYVAEQLDTTAQDVVRMMRDAKTDDPGMVYALAELVDAKNADELRAKVGTGKDMERAAAYMTQQMEAGARSDAKESTYTAQTKNAPTAANTAQREEATIPQSPVAAAAQEIQNTEGDLNNGQSAYQGRENGYAGLRAGGQAAAEAGAQALAGGGKEIPGGVGAYTQADLRQVTPAQLGIRGGGNETITLVDAQRLDTRAQAAYDKVTAAGMEPVAFRGEMFINGTAVNGYVENGRVYFRVDAKTGSGLAVSPALIAEHELFHANATEEMIRTADDVVRESMTAEEYDAMYESYRDAYAGIYDFETMSVDEIERLLTEEIAADAYAGLNFFYGRGEIGDAIRAETQKSAPAQRTETQQETTGPPGKASAAGINARTADSAALRRAEALEKSGTDNETIRQETGWYRGRDGKWRFEIDDSGMKTRKAYVSEREKTQALREYTARFKNLTGDGLTNEQRGMLREYVSQRERGEFSDKTYQQLTDVLGDEFENFAAALEGKMSASAGKNDLSLAEYINHPKLFEAYPDLKNVTVRFDSLPDGQKGYFSKRDNTIILSDSLFGEETDVVLHELQHVIQNTEGFTGGASPQYWNREATYNEATEKYRDNRARLLHGLSAEDRALYDEYRSTEREMGAMLDGSVLYDESRMDELEKRSDELYRELYGKEWFGKLNRYDRILGDASEAVKEFYWNTAGEIEARDTAARRRMTAEERKKTPPDLGDADTVFADGYTTSYSIDENFGKNVDDWVKNTPVDALSTSPGYFRVGTTSEALQSIGARTDNIYMRKSKIGTIFEEHPEVTADVIKKVPDILENPVLIMKSLTRSDSIVLLSEEKAKNGNNLMVALELTPKPGGRTEAEFSLVTSAYGRSVGNLQNLINNSELLYLDTNKNRADTWLMQLRVQFPSRQPPYGSIGNIAYAEDGVKITGKKLSELGGVVQKASSGRASVEVEEQNEADKRREWFRKMAQQDRQEAARLMRKDETLARANRGYGRPAPDKGAGQVYRELMSSGKSEVAAPISMDQPRTTVYKVKLESDALGVNHTATIQHAGRQIYKESSPLKEVAARNAAEYVDAQANKNFSEENFQRAKKLEAERTAEEDARIAELFGDSEDAAAAEQEKKRTAARLEAATTDEATAGKITTEVTKTAKSFRENMESISSGAMRMFVNAGDTVRRIAKATGNKSLEGYYFNAGAYSQRAGNWITKGGARTDIDGHKIGSSLADTLAPMRKNEAKYRDFQLYLYHMHNVDRMMYDNSAEIAKIKENLKWVKDKFPQLRELSKNELRQIVEYDGDSPVVRAEAHEVFLAAHKGEPRRITSVATAAAYVLELEKQRSIAERQGLKPVFGYEVTAEESRETAKLLEDTNPEFKQWAKEVYKYSDDLLAYRVRAGLITAEYARNLQKRYPHYVPTLREGTNSRAGRKARKNGGITVSNAIGRAVGDDAVLLPLHTALSRKTVSVMRNAGINQLGAALLDEYEGNKKRVEKYIWNVAESEYTPTDAVIESDEDYQPVFQNIFSVKRDGKVYDITMDEGLTQALNAFQPDKYGNLPVAQGLKKLNDLFKALCTGYNPFFMVRNAVRDWQDAGFYSTDWTTWEKMYPVAIVQIARNGEIWQQYKALGGSYASMLDYTTGMVKEPKSLAGKVWAKYESFGQAIEAAPRLAEFMTILANKGGSKTVNGVKTGKFTQNDLMEAMLGAADITTNFARGGTVTKALNRYFVPFLNPSVQGFDKFIRNATDIVQRRDVKAAATLILKAALINLPPLLLNGLMHGDDDEWDDIPANTKANYYLIKWGNGYWIKIPKGRAIAVLSTAAVYGQEKLNGRDVKFSDVFEVIKSNVAPTDIFNQNIATAWTQTKLLNSDNPGTTWYGGNIESERLQNYRPGERYDEKTDELSKWIGKTFNLSPKKINYLLDQYSGVIGDILLPHITPATSASHPLLAAPKAAFTIDTTSNNRVTSEYYDLLDDLKYDKNDGDLGAEITRRYVSHAGDTVNDYYAQIREIQNDKTLSKGEKNRLVRALKAQLIERQREIIAKSEPYREAVNKYLKEHPELSSDNDAAIAEFAEKYDITEEQAESRMDAIVYREINREIFGAEYALKTYSSDVYDKARTAYGKGVSYDTYYDYYFATKDMHADKDENGKSISGSKKKKVVEYINSLDIPAEQKDALYIAAGYKENSLRYQPWNGGSGSGRGGRRSRKAKALKAPAAPKAAKNVIPEAKVSTNGTKGNAIADFAKMSGGTDIRKATEKAVDTVIKHGNRTITIKGGSPLDYFLKHGKLPSSR